MQTCAHSDDSSSWQAVISLSLTCVFFSHAPALAQQYYTSDVDTNRDSNIDLHYPRFRFYIYPFAHSVDATHAARISIAACTSFHRSSAFSQLAKMIVYQQLAGKAAATIHGRVVTACGKSGVTPEKIDSLKVTSPPT